MFDDVEDVILADGNFEKQSIHNKMYFFFPQVLSNGPAKSRLNSSFGSDTAGSSLICVVGIMLFIFLPVWVHCVQLIQWK